MQEGDMLTSGREGFLTPREHILGRDDDANSRGGVAASSGRCSGGSVCIEGAEDGGADTRIARGRDEQRSPPVSPAKFPYRGVGEGGGLESRKISNLEDKLRNRPSMEVLFQQVHHLLLSLLALLVQKYKY
jgi:hypothetical protein